MFAKRKRVNQAFAGSRWLPDCLLTPLGEGALALTKSAEASLAAQH